MLLCLCCTLIIIYCTLNNVVAKTERMWTRQSLEEQTLAQTLDRNRREGPSFLSIERVERSRQEETENAVSLRPKFAHLVYANCPVESTGFPCQSQHQVQRHPIRTHQQKDHIS